MIELTSLLIELALKSTGILLVTFLLVRVLYRLSAETRHMIWTLGFVALLILPVSLWLTPVIELPVNAMSIESLERKAGETVLPISKLHGIKNTSVNTQNNASLSNPSTHVFDGYRIASMVYVGVTAVLFLILIISIASVSLALRSSTQTNNIDLRRIMESLKKKLSINRSVILINYSRENTPWTWGISKPIIALPDDFNSWTAEEKSNALIHELSHIRRWDILTIMTARAICCLYWFNPLVWIAYKLMSEEAEKACDDSVITNGAKSSLYANQLLSVANSIINSSNRLYSVPMMARPSSLSTRIKAIINPALRRNTVNVKTILTSLIITFSIAIPFGAIATTENNLQHDGNNVASNHADRARIILNKVAPLYPREAYNNGVEGTVVVEYTVTDKGNVTNASIVESRPAGVFDQSALKAVKHFLYAPEIVDGERVSVPGVRNVFTFKTNFGKNLKASSTDGSLELLEEKGPSDVGDLRLMVDGYLQKSTPEKALSLLESRASEMYMDDPNFYDLFNRSISAVIDTNTKKRSTAYHDYELQVLEERSGDAHALLASIYIDSRDWKRAFSHLVLAFELGVNENVEVAKFQLGMVLVNLGRLDDAKLVFSKLEVSAVNTKAGPDKTLSNFAKEWSVYVDKEIARMDSLGAAVLKNAAL